MRLKLNKTYVVQICTMYQRLSHIKQLLAKKNMLAYDTASEQQSD